jgi:superfamily II DNA helicase RecQ
MMLSHFGEGGFARQHCRSTCDNCQNTAGQSFGEEDLSDAAKKGEQGPGAAGQQELCFRQSAWLAVAGCGQSTAALQHTHHCRLRGSTLNTHASRLWYLLATHTAVVEVIRCIGGGSVSHVVDVFRGNNTVGVRRAGHGSAPVHGIGRTCCRNNGEAERLVRRMVVRGILVEETHRPEMHLAVLSTLAVRCAAAAVLRCRRCCAALPPPGMAPPFRSAARFVVWGEWCLARLGA